MDKLIFTITDAGRQEIINASNTGTEKVEIKSVGVGNIYYLTSPDQTEIGGEIKRITGIGGAVISADTIHVSAKDDSNDEYVVHTVGLYTDKGTLFAVYSRKEPIINKSASTVMLISSDITFKSLDTANITFGDVVFINPPASESVVGVSRFATAEEVEEGLDPALSVSAKRLKGELDKKANLDSPNLTGTPTAPTAAESDNSQKIATTAFIKQVLLAYAKLASPNFTGKPTAPTADHSSNDTQIATTAFVRAAIAALVDSSPGALDTLNELAAAIGNDPNFATTMLNALAGKQPLDGTLTNLSGKDVPALLQYLGLVETINLAAGAVPSTRKINGHALAADTNVTAQDIFNGKAIGIDAGQNLNDFKTAGLYFQGMNVNTSSALNYPENNAGALIVLRSAGITQIYYVYNSSRIWSRSQYSNGGWTPWAREYNTQNKPGAADVGALPITGGALNGSLGIGVANGLGGNSIVLGDNDTGFKQEGDGILNVYANSALVMRFISSLIESLKPLKVNGNCIATGEIQAGNGAVRLAADGNVYGTMWGGWLRDYLAATFQPKGNFTPAGQAYTKAESDARYVQNIRVSAPQERKFWDGAGWSGNDSAFATAIWMVGGSSNVGGLYVRYLQRNINGTWINVTE